MFPRTEFNSKLVSLKNGINCHFKITADSICKQ